MNDCHCGDGLVRCPECEGEGDYLRGSDWIADGRHMDDLRWVTCSDCDGSGQIDCPDCEDYKTYLAKEAKA
jgi:DnaJ-class molecular chaperone